MNIQNASIVVTPNAYKAGKLYSLKPTNGSGDFDFTRSGNATRVNSGGLIELVSTNVPRLNYPLIDGVVNGCPSLLLEPQRTNLVTYSEDFSNAAWTKSNSLITSNSVISPDGTLNADKLVENTSTGSHQVYDVLITASGNFSNSIFVKAAERSKIRINSGSNSFRVDFDLSNGTVISEVGATGNIVSISNGWYKCDISWNTVIVSAQYFLISLLDDSGTQSYQGDGTSGIYIWGAQLEQGSYPTSYIPNYGTALGATRSAETCNNAGNVNTFNDSEGVLYAEISSQTLSSGNDRVLSISDGTINNRIFIGFRENAGGVIYCFVVVGGVTQANYNTNITSLNTYSKVTLKYKQNDFSIYVNGFKVYEDTSGSIFPNGTLSNLSFNQGISSNNFYGNTKQIQYFNTALNDSDLETLTSWDSFSDMATSQLYTIE